jgi:hypothetical protein
MICNSVKRNQYHSLQNYISDWQLLFDNCRIYNMKGSDIYNDACFMETVFYDTLANKAKELHLELPSEITV